MGTEKISKDLARPENSSPIVTEQPLSSKRIWEGAFPQLDRSQNCKSNQWPCSHFQSEFNA